LLFFVAKFFVSPFKTVTTTTSIAVVPVVVSVAAVPILFAATVLPLFIIAVIADRLACNLRLNPINLG